MDKKWGWIFLLLIMCGCSVWKETKTLYKEYIYPVSRVDLEKKEEIPPCKEHFANYLTEVDGKLQSLIEKLDVQESLPDENWAKSLISDYKWLNGIEVLDNKKEVVFQYPKEQVVKDIVPKLTNLEDYKLSFQVINTDFGPEFVLYKKFITSTKIDLLLVVYFDLRSLFCKSQDSSLVEIYTEDSCLWPENNKLRGINWSEMLRHRTNGVLAINGEKWLWLARKVGEKWLIYAYLCGKV
ncbi:hypothetical protein [Desulfonauticus submarinus]